MKSRPIAISIEIQNEQEMPGFTLTVSQRDAVSKQLGETFHKLESSARCVRQQLSL